MKSLFKTFLFIHAQEAHGIIGPARTEPPISPKPTALHTPTPRLASLAASLFVYRVGLVRCSSVGSRSPGPKKFPLETTGLTWTLMGWGQGCDLLVATFWGVSHKKTLPNVECTCVDIHQMKNNPCGFVRRDNDQMKLNFNVWPFLLLLFFRNAI